MYSGLISNVNWHIIKYLKNQNLLVIINQSLFFKNYVLYQNFKNLIYKFYFDLCFLIYFLKFIWLLVGY